MMEGKYGEIIYTRCAPSYSLTGEVVRSGGYGIYSMSRACLPSQEQEAFINKILQTYQYSGDCPASEFYYYVALNDNDGILGRFVPRGEATQEDLEAGVDTRASHTAQFLLGTFDRYPFEIMGSSYFDADKKPYRFYYRKEPTRQNEKISDSEVPSGSITRKRAMQFVMDGRMEAVQAAVSMLLEQFELPKKERKILLIEDSEENLQLWIAAIGYSFPVRLSRQIGFSTCLYRAGKENANFYYTYKRNGSYCLNANISDPGVERTPWVMIAGANPKDSLYRRPSKWEPYAVINGSTKKAEFDCQPEIMNSQYIKSLIIHDNVIEMFCKIASEVQNIRLGKNLCDTFQLIKAIADQDEKKYENFVEGLKNLLPQIEIRSLLWKEELEDLLKAGRYRTDFMMKDEENNLELLKILTNLASQLSRKDLLVKICEITAQRMETYLSEQSDGKDAEKYIKAASQMERIIWLNALDYVVGKKGLRCVRENSFHKNSTAKVTVCWYILNEYREKIRKTSWRNLLNDEALNETVGVLVEHTRWDNVAMAVFLKYMDGERAMQCSFIEKFAEQYQNNSKERKEYWNTLLDKGISPLEICEVIEQNIQRKGNLNHADTEQILTRLIADGRDRHECEKMYQKYLAEDPNAGQLYYITCMNASKGAGNSDVVEILKSAELVKNANKIVPNLLTVVEEDRSNLETASEMELKYFTSLSEKYGIETPNINFQLFLIELFGGGYEKRVVQKYLNVNASGKRFVFPTDFLISEKGKQFVDCIIENCEEPAVIVLAVMTFKFSGEYEQQKYLDFWAKEICIQSIKRKRNALASVIAVQYFFEVGDRELAQMIQLFGEDEVQVEIKKLLTACYTQLADMKTEKISDRLQLSAEKKYGAVVAEKIGHILDQAQQTYGEHHSDGFFSKLFRSFGKNKK